MLLVGVISIALATLVGTVWVAASPQKGPVYAVNANGQTYAAVGNLNLRTPDEEPDLIACAGIDGTEGYCYKTDLDGERPKNPEEALEYMRRLEKAIAESEDGYTRVIPLYESDGETVIGSFGIGVPSRADGK
jgi:hypothetical protein